MKRLATIAAVALACAPGSARAVTLLTPDGRVAQPYQQWADASYVPTPRAAVTFYAAPCPGHPSSPGCHPVTGPPTIYENVPIATVTRRVRFVFFHELGHVYDAEVPAARAATGLGPERFANAYALCSLHRTIPRRWNDHDYGYRPTPARHRRTCARIRATRRVRSPGSP